MAGDWCQHWHCSTFSPRRIRSHTWGRWLHMLPLEQWLPVLYVTLQHLRQLEQWGKVLQSEVSAL